MGNQADGWTGGEKCPRRLREGRWWAGALSQRLKPSTTSSVTSGSGVCAFCKLSSVGLRVAKARARTSCSAGGEAQGGREESVLEVQWRDRWTDDQRWTEESKSGCTCFTTKAIQEAGESAVGAVGGCGWGRQCGLRLGLAGCGSELGDAGAGQVH